MSWYRGLGRGLVGETERPQVSSRGLQLCVCVLGPCSPAGLPCSCPLQARTPERLLAAERCLRPQSRRAALGTADRSRGSSSGVGPLVGSRSQHGAWDLSFGKAQSQESSLCSSPASLLSDHRVHTVPVSPGPSLGLRSNATQRSCKEAVARASGPPSPVHPPGCHQRRPVRGCRLVDLSPPVNRAICLTSVTCCFRQIKIPLVPASQRVAAGRASAPPGACYRCPTDCTAHCPPPPTPHW